MRTAHSARPPAAARLLAALFFVLAAAGAAVAQQPSGPVFPPTLRVGLAPPEGFVLEPMMPGFRHATMRAEIRLGELPGSAYPSIEARLADEVAKSGGTAVRHDITLDAGFPAVLVQSVHSSAQGPVMRWMLVATAHDVTAVVTALIPEAIRDDVAPSERLMAALATLTIRAAVPLEEQLSALPFAMHELSGFRLVRVQPGMAAMLTDGPKDTVENGEQPLLLITIAPMPTTPRPEERDGLARRMIGEAPGLKEIRVLRAEPLRVAGQQGHELLIEAKNAADGSDISMVQWLRFGSGTILRIVGMARKEEWEDSYRRFRAIRDGIGPR